MKNFLSQVISTWFSMSSLSAFMTKEHYLMLRRIFINSLPHTLCAWVLYFFEHHDKNMREHFKTGNVLPPLLLRLVFSIFLRVDIYHSFSETADWIIWREFECGIHKSHSALVVSSAPFSYFSEFCRQMEKFGSNYFHYTLLKLRFLRWILLQSPQWMSTFHVIYASIRSIRTNLATDHFLIILRL